MPLASVSFAFGHLEPFEEPLGASRVVAVDTRGKAMLTRFSCGLTVYSHNQLYGRWFVGRAEPPPRTTRSLRFAIVGEAKAAHLYSASSIDVVPTEAGKRCYRCRSVIASLECAGRSVYVCPTCQPEPKA